MIEEWKVFESFPKFQCVGFTLKFPKQKRREPQMRRSDLCRTIAHYACVCLHLSGLKRIRILWSFPWHWEHSFQPVDFKQSFFMSQKFRHQKGQTAWQLKKKSDGCGSCRRHWARYYPKNPYRCSKFKQPVPAPPLAVIFCFTIYNPPHNRTIVLLHFKLSRIAN